MKAAAIIIAAVAAIVIGAIVTSRREATSSREFSMITGETKENQEIAGYALLGSNITSPGPTIRVRKSDRVTITLKNVHGTFYGEKIPHNFVVVRKKEESAAVLWGAKSWGDKVSGLDRCRPNPLGLVYAR